jgi:hypothetical protein
LVSKLILQFKEFLRTLGISCISFSVKVSYSPFSANHISSVIASISLLTSAHSEKTLNFQFLIITVSLSSKLVNSLATFHSAFISLDKNIQ